MNRQLHSYNVNYLGKKKEKRKKISINNIAINRKEGIDNNKEVTDHK